MNYRSQGSEKAMRLIINSCCEEQCIRGAVVGRGGTERNGPKARNHDWALRAEQKSHECARGGIEGRNLATTKVAYQDVLAEMAEISGGHCDAPRRVQPRTVLEFHEQMAATIEFVDKAQPSAIHFIRPTTLLSEADKDIAADILNTEWRVTLW